MLDVQYLRNNIKELEKDLDALNRVISDLNRQLVAMSMNDIRRDEIEYENKKKEKEREKLQARIKQCTKQMIYKALMYIDYHPQMEFFQTLCKDCYTGAFLLHGSVLSERTEERISKEGYSIRSLLNRMVYHIPGSETTPLIQIDFGVPGQGNVATVWDILADELNIDMDDETRENIINGVCERLQTENVILVFRRIDYLDEESLKQLIREVWEPLATVAHACRSSHSRLFMFLVDYTGSVKGRDITYVERHDKTTWDPTIPIRPPVVVRLTERELEHWIVPWSEALFDILPDALTQGPLDNRIEKILNESNNGEPDLVLWHLCSHCQLVLGGMNKCLKL